MVDTSSIDLDEINSAFWPNQDIESAIFLDGGLVHHSIKVRVNSTLYLLQQINQEVFTKPSTTISNIEAVTNHLIADSTYDLDTPRLIQACNGTSLFRDKNGNFWRCMTYIPHDDTFAFKNNTKTAFAVAKAFGKFGASLSNLDIDQILDTIPLFHDPDSRLQKFDHAVVFYNGKVLSSQANQLLSDIVDHRYIAENFADLSLPERIAHNDAKPSNVLFDPEGQPLAIIDLDTVMPGSPLLDFADLARSMANPVAEDHPDTSDVAFSADIYHALKAGFIEGLRNKLSDVEVKHLSDAVGYIIYEQCLRFMTDFLQGNVYYKVSYATHNLVRAGNQMKLLKSFVQQGLT